MKAVKRIWPLALLLLALGLPLAAKDDANDDVPADVPVRVEKDLFHPPVRLAAAAGARYQERPPHCRPFSSSGPVSCP